MVNAVPITGPFVLSSRSIGSNTDILTQPFYVMVCLFPGRFRSSWLISAAFALGHRPRSVKDRVVVLPIQNGWHFVEQIDIFTEVSCPFSACNLPMIEDLDQLISILSATILLCRQWRI